MLRKEKTIHVFGRRYLLILPCLTGLEPLKEKEYIVLRILMHLVSDGCTDVDPKSQLLLREAKL